MKVFQEDEDWTSDKTKEDFSHSAASVESPQSSAGVLPDAGFGRRLGFAGQQLNIFKE